jgi:NitT/TauT family transport system ATP-binding protein
MPWRTVQENIALPLELAGMPRAERQQRADALVRMLRLDGFAQTYPGALSGGMAQRAALGRLLAQGPDVLLLDEPFGALDAITREQVSMDLLRLWQQSKLTVLMVTHDISEAVLLSDRVLVMSQRPGQIIEDVPVELPRPRHVNMVYDPQFSGIARQVRAALDSQS